MSVIKDEIMFVTGSQNTDGFGETCSFVSDVSGGLLKHIQAASFALDRA